jgi:glycosyltransferase involved in cell wall biosynthesis
VNVLLMIHSLSHGGAQRQIVALARGLLDRGHRTTLVAFYPGGALEAEVRAAGIPFRSLDKRERWDLVRFGLGAARTVCRLAPDVLYSFLIAPNLLAAALRAVRPDMRVFWGVRASEMDLSRYDRLARVTFRAGCVLSRLPRRVIVNSHAGRDYHLAQGYPAEKLVVIPNGIDTAAFRPDRAGGERLRDEWGLPRSAPVIGVVGRLDPMKDHETFLEAARRFSRDVPEARFVCVGTGPDAYAQALVDRSAALDLTDRVTWAGDRDDMPAVYGALDLATSTSAFGEGFPNVVGEALACGVPCVVTDVGDSARVVGDPARVVPPRDPERLAAAWRSALDPRDGGDAGRLRARVEREFSIAAMVERTERQLVAG